jgi:2,4-dienoyl-CoA reductase-like NADH-dependent reductase (Old Yellow Enzyme family)
MWKPEERIRYQPIDCQWPTQEQAASSQVFQATAIGPVTLAQKTWIPAMVPWRSNVAGEVTEDVIQWYERYAQGQPGAIVIEATGIRDVPSGPLLRISHDRYIDGLSELLRRVKAASNSQTKVLIQIIDFLAIKRRPNRDAFLTRFLKITPQHIAKLNAQGLSEDELRQRLIELPDDALQSVLSQREYSQLSHGYREYVTDLELPQIAELPAVLPDLFASAASRAAKAGFDGIELHYAHAYTMASFLSAKNNRTDGYGGSREARIKLPIEVFKRVRKAVGSEVAVGCRFLSDECIDSGSNLEDACFYAVEFAKAGMDFLSLSRGGKFDDAKQPKVGSAAYPYTGPSGYECMPGHISDEFGPFGRNIEPSNAVRAAVVAAGFTTPIVCAGGIHNFQQAEQLLIEKQADIVGMARQAMADPDWFRKVKSGNGNQVKLCEYTNYCEGLDQKHKQVTCQLWDREKLDEPNIRMSHDGKRRLIAPTWNPETKS